MKNVGKQKVTCSFMMNVVATTSFLLPSYDLSRGYKCNYICWHHKNIGAFTFCFIAKSFLVSGGDKVSKKGKETRIMLWYSIAFHLWSLQKIMIVNNYNQLSFKSKVVRALQLKLWRFVWQVEHWLVNGMSAHNQWMTQPLVSCLFSYLSTFFHRPGNNCLFFKQLFFC